MTEEGSIIPENIQPQGTTPESVKQGLVSNKFSTLMNLPPSNGGGGGKGINGVSLTEVTSAARAEGEPQAKEGEAKDGLQKEGQKGKEEVATVTTVEAKAETEAETAIQTKLDDSAKASSDTTPPKKTFSGKAGEKVIEVPEDAVFTFKADGKEVSVPQSELIRSFQSRQARDRHFHELQTAKQQIEDNDTFIKEFIQTAKGNPWQALAKLSIRAGHNPAEFLPGYITQMQKTVEEMSGLTPEQRENKVLKEQIRYKEELEKEKGRKQQQTEASQKEFQEILEIQRAHNVTEGEVEFVRDFFAKQVEVGALKLEDKTPKEIAVMATDFLTKVHRPYQRIEGVIKKHYPELSQDTDFVQTCFKTIQATSPNASEDDIIDILDGYTGKNKPQPSSESEDGADSEVPNEPSRPERLTKTTPEKKTLKKEKRKSEQDDEDDIGVDLRGYIRKKYSR